MSQVIVLDDFPMPPSLNDSYQSVTKTFHTMRGTVTRSAFIGTPDLVKFKAEMAIWKAENFPLLMEARGIILQWMRQEFEVRVDFHFLWSHESIFTQTKRAKSRFHRLDADNRIKAGRDGLSECLEIDDTYFVDGRIEKAIQVEGKRPCAIIRVSKTKIRTAQQILKEYSLDQVGP